MLSDNAVEKTEEARRQAEEARRQAEEARRQAEEARRLEEGYTGVGSIGEKEREIIEKLNEKRRTTRL